ncbi:MAG TPA: hypothetical protein VLX92_21815 [Kofleriaceae bacterium]|nr:hypothetical protein [Kofleriaceae bacterium]
MPPTDHRLRVAIAVACAAFIAVLLGSAYLEHDIIVLHAFQALIYVATAGLCWRRHKLGYAIGLTIAVVWNAYNLFVSGFIQAGFHELHRIAAGERVTSAMNLIGGLGGIDHFALIALLIWAYARHPDRRPRDAWLVPASAALVVGYFLAILAVFWPEFFRR